MNVMNNIAAAMNIPPELLCIIGLVFIGILALKLLKAIGKTLMSAAVIGLIIYAFAYM